MRVGVLLVEPSASDACNLAAAVRRALGESAEPIELDITIVPSAAAAQRISLFDVAIVEPSLPDGRGVELVRGWRKRRRLRGAAVLLVTDAAQSTDTSEGYLLGAATVPKRPATALVACVMETIRRHARRPRSLDEEIARFVTSLSSEHQDAGLPLTPALVDLTSSLLHGRTYAEVGELHGKSAATVKSQARELARLLRERGLDIGESLALALMREMIEDRYE